VSNPKAKTIKQYGEMHDSVSYEQGIIIAANELYYAGISTYYNVEKEIQFTKSLKIKSIFW
jgi:hypothetical protein